MENKKEKIAAVVVTYNRKQLLKECLDALLSQTRPLDSIILIDNASTDGTLEFLKESGYLDNPKIDYVRLPENTGGAGGFYEGVKRGYEKGYDWLWLMDDDGKPLKDTLELLLKGAKENNLKVINAVSVSDLNEKTLSFGDKKFKKVEDLKKHPSFKNDILWNIAGPFNGGLIHREVVKIVGYPNKNYFIYGDDVDYFFRIKKFFKIGIYVKALFLHPPCKLKKINFLGIKFYIFWQEEPLLNFFNIRNFCILFRTYPEYISVKDFLKETIKRLMFICFFTKEKIKNLKLFFFALFYGLQRKFEIPTMIKKA
jgi:GT2 family glycosyltransferase